MTDTLNSAQEIEREHEDLRNKYEAMRRRALIAEEAIAFEYGRDWDYYEPALARAECDLIASGAIKPLEKESDDSQKSQHSA